MRHMSRIAVLFLLACGYAAAQQDAIALLQRVADRYKTVTRYHLESTTEGELKSEWQRSWSKNMQTLAKAESNRLRFEAQERMDGITIVSDGKTIWWANLALREFTTAKLTGPLLEAKGSGPVADMGLRRLQYALKRPESLLENIKSAQVLRDETVQVGAAPVSCTVIQAEYAPPPLAKGIDTVTRTYWVDKQRHVLVQEHAVTRGKLFASAPFEEAESTYRVRYTKIILDEPLPDSLFTYTPPATFQHVSSLKLPTTKPPVQLVGKSAPELSLPTLDGKPMTLADLRGKAVLLDFWATWCVPCREQMPSLAKLHAETKDQGLVLLGINDDEKPEVASKYLQEHGYAWPSLFDGTKHEARARYQVDGIPSLVLLNPQGVIVEYRVGGGPDTDAAIRATLRKLGFQLEEKR